MRTRLPLLAAVVALLAVGMLAAAFGNPAIEALPIPQVSVSGAPREADDEASRLAEVLPPEATDPTVGAGGFVLALLGVVILLVAVGLAWWLARANRGIRFTRIRPVLKPAAAGTAQRVRAAIDAGLSELDEADGDPRRAVIACWVRLEAAAAQAGVARAAGDTSTQLVSRVLAQLRVSADVLAAFAELYREARFATHDVDPSTRDRARAALGQIRAELAQAQPGIRPVGTVG